MIAYDAVGNVINSGEPARATLQDQIKTTLGDERYAQYQKSRDSSYEALTRLGERFGLASETVGRAYALQEEFNSQISATLTQVKSAQERSAEQRRLGQQFQAQRNQILGDRASKAFRRNYGEFFDVE